MADLMPDADRCLGLAVVTALLAAGGRAVAGSPDLRARGHALAGVAALAYVGYRCRSDGGVPDDVVGLGAGTVFVGLAVLGAGWLALPALDALYRLAVLPPLRGLARAGGLAGRLAAAPFEARDRARARRAAAEREGRERPARERAARAEAERRTRAEADHRRREEARAACELLYARHAPEVAARLPQAAFDAFVARLLSDDTPADVAERRAAELQQLVRAHAEHAAGGRAETPEQVRAWHAEQLRQVAAVADERLRQSFEALLQRYHDRMMRALGGDA